MIMKNFGLLKIERKGCPIKKAIDIIGDKWILLILRESLFGVKRFEDFQKELRISRSVLSAKLNHMVVEDLLYLEDYKISKRRKRNQYKLTEKGFALIKLMIGLYEWGSNLGVERETPPYSFAEKLSRSEIKLKISNETGNEVDVSDIRLKF